MKDLPIGSLAAVPGAPAIVGRDAGGVYAMTSTCTHAGCSSDPQSNGTIYCPCHGSRFDSNGNVVNGPARNPLAHFAVEIDAQGNILVHGETQVGPSTRTPVPSGLG